MSGPGVALLVTSLMGAGHLVRVLALGRALAAAGARVRVISGGRPVGFAGAPGVEVVQLPPLASDGVNYRRLLRPDGAEADGAWMAARAGALAGALREMRPAALVTELWPFGRRRLAAEFRLAREVCAGAAWFVSVRDLPEPPKGPGRVAEALAALQGCAGVLVHGDPSVARFEDGWPGDGVLPEGLAGVLRHTGYVCDPAPPPAGPREVLVATGGGVVGRGLLGLAARAAAVSGLAWRLRVGGADAEAVIAGLRGLGPAVVEPAQADHRARLGAAAVSVSLAGYNSAVEAALSGTPALLVPMEEGGEREQLLRAAAFARLPGIETARLGALTPEGLAARVARLAAGPGARELGRDASRPPAQAGWAGGSLRRGAAGAVRNTGRGRRADRRP